MIDSVPFEIQTDNLPNTSPRLEFRVGSCLCWSKEYRESSYTEFLKQPKHLTPFHGTWRKRVFDVEVPKCAIGTHKPERGGSVANACTALQWEQAISSLRSGKSNNERFRSPEKLLYLKWQQVHSLSMFICSPFSCRLWTCMSWSTERSWKYSC
jgi:hypothetical protein